MTRLVEVCFSTLPLSLGQKFWIGSLMYFLSMHLFITVMKTAGKKVIYWSISRQPPFCVFDDVSNLSVYHSNIIV